MMADDNSVFEHGENLQNAIGKSLQEDKALLCFVSAGSDEDTRWENALLDLKIRERLQASTVLLRLQKGSEQAGFLNSVCPIQSSPAIVIIHNAQVIANYQNCQTTFAKLQEELNSKYGSTESGKSASQDAPLTTSETKYIELPPSEGRMRLPNNAYDQFRKMTQQFVSAGVNGKNLLQIQLRLLSSLDIDTITAAVKAIQERDSDVTEPYLSDEATQRLLNTPASRLQGDSRSAGTSESSSQVQSSSSNTARNSSPTLATSSSQPDQPPIRSQPSRPAQNIPTTSANSEPSVTSSTPTSPPPTSSPTSQSSQRNQYIAAQKSREAAQQAERARIKSQIAADKAARRESEAAAAAEARRLELFKLRKANSTTSDPKASDVRIQVRLFDGGTIRNSFPAEATVSREVRGWIDEEVVKKAEAAASTGKPYNLKLILTPLPNRTIEAGEEDSALSDLEGIKGSATLIMVPVKGYVDSYSGSGGGGIVGGVVGGATSVVGAGIGLVGAAAGMVVGGLGRLLGAGGGASAHTPQQQQQGSQSLEESTAQAAGSSGNRLNVRVRTLADQRKDEDEERRRKGNQLYNGMGLNVQPRKDDDQDQQGSK